MVIRLFLASAILTALVASPVAAETFRCGKTFITFPALDEASKEYDSISVRKSDILRG